MRTPGQKPSFRIEYFETAYGWYWRIKAKNGRKISDGAEGYASEAKVKRAINRFIDLMVDWAAAADLEIVKVDY